MIGPYGHGISKYLEELVQRFGDEDPLTERLKEILNVSKWADVRSVFLIRPDCAPSSPVRSFETKELNISCYHPVSWLRVPLTLRLLQADLYFNPTFASYPYLPCDYVQTIHDLNHLHFGNLFQKIYYELLLKPSIRNARQIFTVSKFVRSEIMNWAFIAEDQVVVTYNQIQKANTVEAPSLELVLSRFDLTQKGYFLCVSNPKQHKNLEMLIRAYRRFQTTHSRKAPPLLLTVPIDSGLDVGEGVVPVGSITDVELSALYCGALAFFYPSLYEGFGRPPIEAALCGTSVYASDIPPHREGAQLFQVNVNFLSPSEPEVWAHAFGKESEKFS